VYNLVNRRMRMGEPRRFVQEKGRTKRQLWEIWREGNAVFTQWGQDGGAMQKTKQEFEGVNIGKANEKEPIDVAQEFLERQALMKTRKGYLEIDKDGDYLDPAPDADGDVQMDFRRLPEHLRFLKPQNTPNAYMEKLAAKGKAWYSRKRNGMMRVITIDDEREIWMYSSTLQPNHKDEPGIPWMDRFPHLTEELSQMHWPAGTIPLCELVSGPDKDNLQYVGSIEKSLTDRALELQEDTKPLCLCIWDLAFHDHKPVIATQSYRQRRELLEQKVFGNFGNSSQFEHIVLPEVLKPGDDGFDGSFDSALVICKANGWEGFVVIDPDAVFDEDRAISWHGKPGRPKQICKLKPKWEADFILRWDPDNGIGTRGKGKKSVGVGAFFAYLIDENGKEVYVSKVGGGLTDENVRKYAVPGLKIVAEVAFASITAKGSLEFPEFIRERTDKTAEECTLDQLLNIKEQLGE
jgi:hypothetical protein